MGAVLPDYRLAPEHAVPRGGRGRPRRLGGAARRGRAARPDRARRRQRRRRARLRAPAPARSPAARRRRPASLAFSPWTDLTLAGASLAAARAARRLPAGGAAGRGRATSTSPAPIRATRAPRRASARFAGAPPVLIQASRAEILLDDARMMAARLAADGAAVTLDLCAGGAARLAGLPRPAARGRRRAGPRRGLPRSAGDLKTA